MITTFVLEIRRCSDARTGLRLGIDSARAERFTSQHNTRFSEFPFGLILLGLTSRSLLSEY